MKNALFILVLYHESHIPHPKKVIFDDLIKVSLMPQVIEPASS